MGEVILVVRARHAVPKHTNKGARPSSSLRKNHLSPHPLPPLRLTTDFDNAHPGGEGVEKIKEAGGPRPPASLRTTPLPRLDDLALPPQFAGGGDRGGGLKAIALFQQPARTC